MPPNDGSLGVDGWSKAQLLKSAAGNSGTGADSELPEEVRFLAGVARVLRSRKANPGAKADPAAPAVFLLKPRPPDGHEVARIPMLNNGRTPVTGRVWFVSAVPNSGHVLKSSPPEDDDALFRFVENSLKGGETPAIVFDPRVSEREIRFYPRGLAHPDDCELLRIDASDITVESIFEEIDRIHAKCMITPDAQLRTGKLWEDKAKFIPSGEAESAVQLYLKIGLTSAFPSCTIRHEQPMIEGRLDLEIVEEDPLEPSMSTCHAILELKVLRSFTDGAKAVPEVEVLEWIEKGVKQASAYRSSRSAKLAALCCFDMRKIDTGEICFDRVRDLAQRLAVFLRRWYLHATSESLRNEMATP